MVVEFEKDVLTKAKKHFGFRGSIKAASKATKLHINTIPLAVERGRGEERVVKAITKYINKVCAVA